MEMVDAYGHPIFESIKITLVCGTQCAFQCYTLHALTHGCACLRR